MVKFVNLCPHAVHLVGDTGAVITFAESGQIARIEIIKKKKNVIVEIAEGIHLNMEVEEVEHMEVVGLPEPKEGIIYLTSSYVAQAVRRPDVMSPNTSKSSAILDDKGKVIGVKGFQVYVESSN